LLNEPERIREGLERLVEEERREIRGDPVQEQAGWLGKLAEVDQKRARLQDMAAEGLITFDELRTKLAALEETRELARRELAALQDQRDRLQELERDKTALLEHYAAMVPEGLDALSPEERHRVYKMLGLRVSVQPSGILEVSGTFGEELQLSEHEPTRASGARSSARP
jgi:chromosome segregation ATPase